ncbi:MAG: hypothetical protein KF741_05385 [Ferruginibacter sp.]|nr:hypothetical protein [Bacteroidota bacterium]MBX2918661.1 hypothetical protein [Ferruginibacter sp.]MCB0708196.1 hypothetical protein [Chitinophagaceae bacterium]MCC7378799.1 hypothetical protein [Chitinophagaceae bacterium]
MLLRSIPVYCAFVTIIILMNACNGNSTKKDDNPVADSSKKAIKKEEIKKEPEKKFERPPIVNIIDTLAIKKTVIYCADSAATFERITTKLSKIYTGKLAEYAKKNNVKIIGKPMAWFKKQKAPYFFEAALPVNKKGAKAVAGVQVRELAAGKVVVAHFYGPYELLPVGYDAIKEYIKDNKKITAGSPYEIYVTDPIDKDGKPVDPYKIQTDIVFPIK